MLPETFQTARLILRPIALEDVGPIFDSYAQDAVVTRFVIWRPHRGRSDTEPTSRNALLRHRISPDLCPYRSERRWVAGSLRPASGRPTPSRRRLPHGATVVGAGPHDRGFHRSRGLGHGPAF